MPGKHSSLPSQEITPSSVNQSLPCFKKMRVCLCKCAYAYLSVKIKTKSWAIINWQFKKKKNHKAKYCQKFVFKNYCSLAILVPHMLCWKIRLKLALFQEISTLLYVSNIALDCEIYRHVSSCPIIWKASSQGFCSFQSIFFRKKNPFIISKKAQVHVAVYKTLI